MPVYVDDMRAKVGRYVMCHMLATTDAELHEMAAKIGVARKWHQAPPAVSSSHYDIALSSRAKALAFGAIPVTKREAALMHSYRKAFGVLPTPAQALEWRKRRQLLRSKESASRD